MRKRIISILLAVLSVICMLPFGAITAMAMPSQGVYDNRSAADIVQSGNIMDIRSQNSYVVLNFQSFNIAEDEILRFDNGTKIHNYLILVHDNRKSTINGKIAGGNNIYIINPNGVIFGADSQVDVGCLYVSTRPFDGIDEYRFLSGYAPFEENDVKLNGDVVILGTINADELFVEGKDIYLANSSVSNIPAENTTIVSHNKDVPASGSVLSAGYPWTVITVAVAALFGLGGFVLGRKTKKKPALAGDAENKDEE